jgi:hypothetical protein
MPVVLAKTARRQGGASGGQEKHAANRSDTLATTLQERGRSDPIRNV